MSQSARLSVGRSANQSATQMVGESRVVNENGFGETWPKRFSPLDVSSTHFA